MATLAVVAASIASNGALITGVAAAGGGDVFPNSGREYLAIHNDSAAPVTVTIATPGLVSGLAVDDLDVVVAAGASRLVGPFPPRLFSVAGEPGGNASVTYSAATDVKVAVVQVA